MNIIDRAIEFAAKAHRIQTRKGTDIPYISHPYGVGMILLKAGCKEEVVAAGILHDTLEDTSTTEKDLRDQFGQKVLRIVKGCSEPNKDAKWEVRKQHTLDYLMNASFSIRQVACADKLHNLRSIKRDLANMGDEAWSKFNRGRDQQKWYYTQMVESLGYASRFPLLDIFQDEVEELFGPPLRNEAWRKLRRNKEFFDRAFEAAWGLRDEKKLEYQLKKMGGLDLIKTVHSLSYPIHPNFEEEFWQVGDYLQKRGIEFQSNSEGPFMIIGFTTVLKNLLNLYPHEIYHHFNRNVRRGVL